MNITITLVIPALEALIAAGALGAAGAAAGAATDDKPATRTRKSADKPADKVEEKTETKVEEQDDAATGPSVDDVKAVAKRYNAKMGRDAMASLIEKHGGTSVSTIPEDKRQGFIDEAEIDLD